MTFATLVIYRLSWIRFIGGRGVAIESDMDIFLLRVAEGGATERKGKAVERVRR